MNPLHFLILAASDPGLPPENSGPHTAGWLRWFFLGSVALIIGIAWLVLRGYRGSSDGK